MNTAEHIGQLIFKLLNNELTTTEQQQLDGWLQHSPENLTLFNRLIDESRFHERMQAFIEAETSEKRVYSKIFDATKYSRPVHHTLSRSESRHFLHTAWFRYAAAILLIFGTVAYLLNNKLQDETKNAEVAATQKRPDISPGGAKATLTLADGTTITLDDAANGRLTAQEGSVVIKDKGLVIYQTEKDKLPDGVGGFNTMSTPRGGQYQVRLPDGTTVWLNAESSITYPTKFKGTERLVQVTGEAYFDVAKNNAMPFRVKLGNAEVEVLGTEFNTNSYADENGTRITLVSGSVKVSSGTHKSILKEKSQAVINAAGMLQLQNEVNVADVTAWKNGLFSFTAADIQTIMRQVSRWYDVDVVIKDDIRELFTFEVSRDAPLSTLLDNLSIVGKLKFSQQNNVLTVEK